MKKRCYNKNATNYQYYGGRGIYVSRQWLESFEKFYEDMGPRPSKDHSLDRINNDKNYSKSNCRWATKTEQQVNKRVTDVVIKQREHLKNCAKEYMHKLYGNPLTRTKKLCSYCREIKEFKEFTKNKRSVDGHTTYCKKCIPTIVRRYK
jgi:superfamily II helicase